MNNELGFRKLFVRDASLMLAAVLLWWLASPYSKGDAPLADFAGVVIGAGLGFCAYMLHEWGHIAGGLITRSTMRSGASMRSFSNFVFDSKANNRFQFLVMSFSGFVMTALAVWLFYAQLPADELATRVARGIVLFLVLLGVVLELPLVIWALFRKDLPPIDGLSRDEDASTGL